MTARVKHIEHDRKKLERMMARLHRTQIRVGVQGRGAQEYADERVAKDSQAGEAAATLARLSSPSHRLGPKFGPSQAKMLGPKQAPKLGPKGPKKRRGSGRSVIVPGGSDFRMVDLATVHEFGSKDGRVPQRSFLRSALWANRDKIRRAQRRAMQLAAQGKDPTRTVNRIAVMVVGMVKKQLTELRHPGLAASTKARRKRLTGDVTPNPLIDTGQLRGSITSVVQRGTGG